MRVSASRRLGLSEVLHEELQEQLELMPNAQRLVPAGSRPPRTWEGRREGQGLELERGPRSPCDWLAAGLGLTLCVLRLPRRALSRTDLAQSLSIRLRACQCLPLSTNVGP